MDKWFKDILPEKYPYHNRGRNQMRKKGGPEFECLWSNTVINNKLIFPVMTDQHNKLGTLMNISHAPK